jgi:hypothetical protein
MTDAEGPRTVFEMLGPKHGFSPCRGLHSTS